MTKNLFYKIYFILITFAFLISCNNKTDRSENNKFNNIKEPLVNANKYLKRTETEEINGYIERRKWNMQKTETGVRYWIYKTGNGKKIKNNSIVKLNYKLGLIDGTDCYSSKTDGVKLFKVGEGKVESGLDEAARLLCEGDKAKIIIPSHLGYGLLGDNNKIPKRATLIYDIEVLEVK